MHAFHESRYGRRRVLRGTLATLGALGAVSGLDLGLSTTVARAAAGRADTPGLPEVPGMLGDRLANEFWYQFDEATYFRRTPELADAYLRVGRHLGGNSLTVVRDAWIETAAEPGYPRTYAALLRPVREPLRLISRTQVEVFEKYYGRRPDRIIETMAYFAQGVLFDPRRAPVQAEVHTMDGDPPLAYHTWHAYQYASVLLGLDRAFWSAMIPVNGFAWALQLRAKPDSREVNPPLPPATVARVATSWLPRSPRRIDADLLAYHRRAGG